MTEQRPSAAEEKPSTAVEKPSAAHKKPTAAQQWADQLAAWAIPEEILEQAPDDPWRCPVGLFKTKTERDLERAETPSRLRALESLPDGGTVLDVGAGAGAASLALVPPAAHITGVDSNARMLAAFADGAEGTRAGHDEVEGPWPEVAPRTPRADVVVCHHVFYNVPDLGAFAAALTDHARRRVVVELTASHPQTTNNYLWRHFWRLERPTGPTAQDAIAVLRELGLEVQSEAWERPPRWDHTADRDELVAFVRRNLCLPPERDPEVDALIDAPERLTETTAYTLWWDGGAPRRVNR